MMSCYAEFSSRQTATGVTRVLFFYQSVNWVSIPVRWKSDAFRIFVRTIFDGFKICFSLSQCLGYTQSFTPWAYFGSLNSLLSFALMIF